MTSTTSPAEHEIPEAIQYLEAHIYAIAFDSGLIKVGYSNRPAKRIGQHASPARRHGHAISAQWISPPHTEALANERKLIAFCEARCSHVEGREYFTGLAFEEVRSYAESLTFERATEECVRSAAEDAERSRREYAALTQKLFRNEPLPALVTLDAFVDGGDTVEVWGHCARLVGLTFEEVACLPEDMLTRFKQHALDHLNLLEEVARLEELAGIRLRALVELLSNGSDELRRDARLALEAGRPSVRTPLSQRQAGELA